MAQRAIIGINGELLPFSEDVAKLRTPGIDGSSITWVPDADTKCAALTVRANGTYNAADKNVYGFDYVAVSVPGESVTGKDPTTGQEVVVTKDPTTGEIVETVVPTEIRVTTPPTFTGPYGDGAYIDFTGLSVAAYDANGNKMQDVPFGELLFPVTVTVYDPEAGPVEYGAKSELTGGNVVECAATFTYTDNYRDEVMLRTTAADGKITGFLNTGGAGGYYLGACSEAGNTIVRVKPESWRADLRLSYTYGGKTVYYMNVSDSGIRYNPTVPQSEYYKNNRYDKEIAWTMIYGDISQTGGGMAVPVQWSRPGDSAILETEFHISVVDVAPSGS